MIMRDLEANKWARGVKHTRTHTHIRTKLDEALTNVLSTLSKHGLHRTEEEGEYFALDVALGSVLLSKNTKKFQRWISGDLLLKKNRNSIRRNNHLVV